MIDNEVVTRHCRELARRVHPVYRLFDVLEEAALPPDNRAALQRELSRLVDTVVSNDLPLRSARRPRPGAGSKSAAPQGPGALATLRALLQLPYPECHTALAAWMEAVAAASPSRQAMHLILEQFSRWLDEASADVRGPFLELLPILAPLLAELGDDGVRKLLETAGRMSEPADRQLFFECARAYGVTTGASVAGLCEIARPAIDWRRPEYLRRLLAAVEPEKAMETRDGRELLPALAHLSTLTASKGEAAWCRGMALILTLAEKNHSSACVAARRAAGSLRERSPEEATAYLADFARLVDTVGARIVGFGTQTLPALYRSHGIEATRAFVEAAATAAELCGVSAGQAFLEGVTAAAREALGRGTPKG